jgi:polyhydroxyalkanoate synthesis regulator phasin
MDNKEIVKQMIDVHKKSFDNCFSTMVNLQNQAEKIMTTFVDLTPGMTDEGKKVMEQLNSMYKKNRDEFKKAVDDGYEKVEAFFDNDAIAMFQDQTKKMFDLFSNQKSWLPFDFKKTMDDLAAMYKKGCDDLKKQTDDNVQRVEKFYSTSNKPTPNTKK